ncbi:MAG: hypothetical protein L0H29_05495, partial [Sinobacteraceae bacterium]|nr:hypothetical protein [Nevskiaceae bacterium]
IEDYAFHDLFSALHSQSPAGKTECSAGRLCDPVALKFEPPLRLIGTGEAYHRLRAHTSLEVQALYLGKCCSRRLALGRKCV